MTPWCVLANNVFKRGLKKILVLETVICLWKRLEKFKNLKICLSEVVWTMSMDPMKYIDQWFAVHLWRPGDQQKLRSSSGRPGPFPKTKWRLSVMCSFLPGLFLVLITTSCLSANLDKETKTFISFVIENVNKDASFFCNGPFFCDTTWKTCHHYSWHFTHIRLRCHFISAKEPGTKS